MTVKALNHELSKLFNEMWDADVHRLRPGKDYTIEVQGKASPVQQGDSAVQDNAVRHLFHNVNEERLRSIKTFATFISLLDNYETSTGVAEVVTPEEIVENNCFLDAILATEVMRLAHGYLLKRNLAKPNLVDFKHQLYDIWFQLYARKEGDRPDSCGFEHVFVGETRHGKEILGLHNWVQFYLQEKHNQIDYKGYVAQKNKTRPDKDDQVLTIQFSWKGSVKPIGSTFIGVSPEFEFALYTVIFLLSEERVTRETVKIDDNHEAIEFKISGNRRKSANKTSILDIGRADFRLLREPGNPPVDQKTSVDVIFLDLIKALDIIYLSVEPTAGLTHHVMDEQPA
ncbi:hypothetical protein HGM15179_017158 [Zosterops borbonicus]|uniref:Uridylate-specific endoribonuclease n=1 Tax=Zosterops borbonicus TaxID=364589 RepID=A0A8K1LDL9_9PASS|nr:hypothetical protein HGM15179_017158 [Zosterops borbonicus]